MRSARALCPGCGHHEAVWWQPRQWYSAPGAPERLGQTGVRHQPSGGVAAILRGTALGAEFAIEAFSCLGCGLTRRWAEHPAEIPLGPGVIPTWLSGPDSTPSFRGCSHCGGDEAVSAHAVDFVSVLTGRRVLMVRDGLAHRYDHRVPPPHLVTLGALLDHTCRKCGLMATQALQLEAVQAGDLDHGMAPTRVDAPCRACGGHAALETPVRDWAWRGGVPGSFARSIMRETQPRAMSAPTVAPRASLHWLTCTHCAECRLLVRAPELVPISSEHGTRLATTHAPRPVGPYR